MLVVAGTAKRSSRCSTCRTLTRQFQILCRHPPRALRSLPPPWRVQRAAGASVPPRSPLVASGVAPDELVALRLTAVTRLSLAPAAVAVGATDPRQPGSASRARSCVGHDPAALRSVAAAL